jgi:type IV pilus assembly protein PilC
MISIKPTLIFYEELADLINSGITVIEAMQTIEQSVRNARVKARAVAIKRDLMHGLTLSEALVKFPDAFAIWQINIIKYSETSGTLKKGLFKIVENLKADYAIRRKLLVGLAYPVLLFHLAIFLLPVSALLQKGAGAYLSQVGMIIVPVYLCLFAAYGLKRLIASAFVRPYCALVLCVPFWGKFVRSLHLARFTGVLECLCGAGVNIAQGWRIAAESCDNVVLSNILLKGLPVLNQGGTLHAAFAATKVFSAKTLSLVAIGEKSGSLESTLGRIVVYAQQENETVVNLLLTVAPVLIYVVVAGYIGYRVISFYSDYFAKITTY